MIQSLLFEAFLSPSAGVWPLLLMPFLALLLSDAAARAAGDTQPVLVSTIIAVCPGATCLGFALIAIVRGTSHLSQGAEGLAYLSIRTVPMVAAVLLLQATCRLAGQLRGVRRLVRCAGDPSATLESVAREIGIDAREVRHGVGFLFASGVFRCRVIISSDVVESLSPAELRAALLHEKSHIQHRDCALLAIVSWLSMLLPRTPQAVHQLCNALERRADRSAAMRCDPLDLAAALVRLSRMKCSDRIGRAVALQARPQGEERIADLLAVSTRQRPHFGSDCRGMLTLCVAVALTPAAQFIAGKLLCG